MILPALIIIIIILIYVQVYFYYSKDKTNDTAKPPMSAKISVAPTMTQAQPMYPNYANVQYSQEQSRRDRNDSYSAEDTQLHTDEYMTNKYAKSYMQNIMTAPSATNYNEYMISTGLEAGVVDSHKEFTDETQNKTTGASAETVFSHDDSIVPSWGLRRRSAQIPINPNSREVPSQTNEQLADNSQEFKYGLF